MSVSAILEIAIASHMVVVRTGVPMPETSLDLNHGPIFRQNNIRASRKSAHMEAESEPQPVKRLPDNHFRLGVL